MPIETRIELLGLRAEVRSAKTKAVRRIIELIGCTAEEAEALLASDHPELLIMDDEATRPNHRTV